MIASSMPDIAKCNHGKHISYAIIAAIAIWFFAAAH